MTGRGQQRFGLRHKRFGRALPHRAINISRLTKPATANTTPEQLKRHAVVNDFCQRYKLLLRIERLVQIFHGGLPYNRAGALVVRREAFDCAVLVIFRVVKTGHINAVQRQQPAQKLGAPATGAFVSFIYVDDFVKALLGFADVKEIYKISQRLGIIRARPTRANYRGVVAALPRKNRYPRQIQHINQIRITHFVLQRERHKVERTHIVAAFEREQRQALGTHKPLHISPRRKHALAKNIVAPI